LYATSPIFRAHPILPGVPWGERVLCHLAVPGARCVVAEPRLHRVQGLLVRLVSDVAILGTVRPRHRQFLPQGFGYSGGQSPDNGNRLIARPG